MNALETDIGADDIDVSYDLLDRIEEVVPQRPTVRLGDAAWCAPQRRRL